MSDRRPSKRISLDVERLRAHVVRRSWMHGNGRVLSDADYASLKARDGKFWNSLTREQKIYFMGNVDGYYDGNGRMRPEEYKQYLKAERRRIKKQQREWEARRKQREIEDGMAQERVLAKIGR